MITHFLSRIFFGNTYELLITLITRELCIEATDLVLSKSKRLAQNRFLNYLCVISFCLTVQEEEVEEMKLPLANTLDVLMDRLLEYIHGECHTPEGKNIFLFNCAAL